METEMDYIRAVEVDAYANEIAEQAAVLATQGNRLDISTLFPEDAASREGGIVRAAIWNLVGHGFKLIPVLEDGVKDGKNDRKLVLYLEPR